MSCPSNLLLLPRLSQVRLSNPPSPHHACRPFISSGHLTVCLFVQALVRLIRSTITTSFPSFPRSLTPSPTRPSAPIPVRQTTSTSTTCRGVLRSSRRRPNLSPVHRWSMNSSEKQKKKKQALVRLYTPNLHLEQCFLITPDISVRFTSCENKCAGVFLVEVILLITTQHEGSDGIRTQ